MRDRLTYANVVATLALFVALGGTAYGVTQISGAQIRNRSIPGSKLMLRAVGSRELDAAHVTVANAQRSVLADSVAQLVVSKPRRATRVKTAGDSSGSPTSTVIELSAGQTAPVLQAGPYTLTAACATLSDGNLHVQVNAVSSGASWYGYSYVNGSPTSQFGPWAAGQTITIFDDGFGPTQQFLTPILGGLPLLGQDGSFLTIDGAVGSNLGAQCVLSLYAVT